MTGQENWWRRSWRALVALLISAALITGPFLAPIVWQQLANSTGQDPYLGTEKETQTDLVAHVIPNLYHPLWGDVAAPVHQRFLRNKDHAVSLGYVPLVLAAYGLLRWRKDRKIRFWLVGLVIFWVLSLGPFPRINGEPYPGIPLPYRLVGWSFPVRSLRNPERFNIVVGLCLAMVAGGVARSILRRLSRRRLTLCTVALSLLVLLEYWSWPFPTRQPDIPDFYYTLAAERGNFAVVDVPITNDLSKRHMYYQTLHGKPIVTGHVSRPPQGAYDFIASNGLLRAMWQSGQVGSTGDLVEALRSLEDAEVRYLIAHRDDLSEETLRALDAYMSRSPRFSDERVIVYEIAPLP